jgi:hypothetical protein
VPKITDPGNLAISQSLQLAFKSGVSLFRA